MVTKNVAVHLSNVHQEATDSGTTCQNGWGESHRITKPTNHMLLLRNFLPGAATLRVRFQGQARRFIVVHDVLGAQPEGWQA